MTERGRDGERNLTGIWNGLYTYPDGRSISFVATLIDTGGSLTGTTHEPSSRSEQFGATLFATLVGSQRDSEVLFTKTYDPSDASHRRPIDYQGVLNSDATEIEGRWTIVQMWSGKFLMIRSPGRAAEVSREAFART
jgi:hypothetical protein